MIHRKCGVMCKASAPVLLCLLLCVSACAQTLEGKKIVGGHGHAMVSTHLLREYADEMKRAPLDGVIVAVNRNGLAGKDKLRDIAAPLWFRPPVVTIEDFSIAIDDMAKADLGHFKHNIMWCHGLRSIGADLWDDDGWKKVVLPNARVMAEVCHRAPFEAVWFDLETDFLLEPARIAAADGTGPPFEECAAKARQRGRQMMEAFVSAKPDFKLIVSHGYGMSMVMCSGDPSKLPVLMWGLWPAFIDGLIEGCGERAQVIESGEIYAIMTYPFFKASRDWDLLAAEVFSKVSPELRAKNYRHAMGLWPDFMAQKRGWNEEDLDKNYFSPDRLKHALHNAMAASDEYVWTWTWRAHWWPNRSPKPSGFTGPPASAPETEYAENTADFKHVLDDAYMLEVAKSHQPMDLDWHPDRTSEGGSRTPASASDLAHKRQLIAKTFASLEEKHRTLLDLSDGWICHPADSADLDAFGWGASIGGWDDAVEKVYDFKPIKIGDFWENQGVAPGGTIAYRRHLRVSEEARGKRLFLAVAGVADKAVVYLDWKGRWSQATVGHVEGDKLGLFDVSDTIDRDGDNVLTIVVTSTKGPGGIYGRASLLTGDR